MPAAPPPPPLSSLSSSSLWLLSFSTSGGSGSGGTSSPSSSSPSSYSASGPSRQLKSWESGARLVRNTTVENRYLDHIREVHDPSQHVKTIEDELKGTIGKALGKQGQKVLLHARLMAEERERYDERLERATTTARKACDDIDHDRGDIDIDIDHDPASDPDVVASARAYNEHRERCLHARWELIVHRQAVGFIVGNHKYVTDKFPVADALPVHGGCGETTGDSDDSESESKNKKKKKFTDQLDWWERIGRWK
eukprot:jgi/Psemu1/20169/gm1.20169_g